MPEKLSPELIEEAYRMGYFPMAEDDGTIYWYFPKKRAVFEPRDFHVSRSLKKSSKKYLVTFDTAYEEVMRACADREETWISEEFVRAYCELFYHGFGHSAETWFFDELVGGVYGVRFGNVFMAESMFHTKTDAGKVALWKLFEKLEKEGVVLIDVQFMTPHLKSLGAKELSSKEYLKKLENAWK